MLSPHSFKPRKNIAVSVLVGTTHRKPEYLENQTKINLVTIVNCKKSLCNCIFVIMMARVKLRNTD